MSKGPKYGFKLTPGGLTAPTPKRFVDKQLLPVKPTDAAQCAPSETQAVRAHYKLAGGC